jgi:LmbE family N-acetylglucosaminyl deacetylase
MRLSLPTAEIFVPDGADIAAALARTTHLAIAAHHDDIEIMAADGILKAFQQEGLWFTGVVVTNGAGSPRDGLYRDYTDDQMRVVRRKEQKKAASIGDYSAVVLLDHPSSVVKDPADGRPVEDLVAVLRAARPEVVYTHNLADKHDTHVSVALRAIAAVRRLADDERPRQLFGCEVWRDLDWLPDDEKVTFDVSARESLQAALVGVFDSQISGGKRYDLATQGRRRAHATYAASHGTDAATALTYAMDLTPLVMDRTLSPAAYVRRALDRFRADVEGTVAKYQG